MHGQIRRIDGPTGQRSRSQAWLAEISGGHVAGVGGTKQKSIPAIQIIDGEIINGGEASWY
jgi:hypothetical protein